MVAIRKDLTVDHGAGFNVSIQYTDSNAVPVNLTGYGATLTVTTPINVVIQALTGTVDSQGWIKFKATGAQTAIWAAGKQNYFVDLTNPALDIDRLFFGNVNVRRSGLV